MWILHPFARQLRKRERETVLLQQLQECVARLWENPEQPGLNLKVLRTVGGQPILSARLNQGNRLILTPLARTHLGLLHFDEHDQAYAWVDQHARNIPRMLARWQEIERGWQPNAAEPLLPVVRADEESPLALASAAQFRQMLADGMARYLAYLDDEQRALAELNVKGLLVVKGGAGTGKTAVALHRLLNLARQPALMGPDRLLYLCFNNTLARAATQLLRVLNGGELPPGVEVRTFHALSLDLLRLEGVKAPTEEAADAWRQCVYAAYGRLSADQKALLGDQQGRFLHAEMSEVIKHNGLESLERYLAFNRQGRPPLKRRQREVVWHAYESAERSRRAQDVVTWDDLPLLALEKLAAEPSAAVYRAIMVDEGQDCSAVMLRLAKRLVAEGGPLAVFADPSQTIYQNGFQWAQAELKVRGGNVRWLRTNYRATREVFAFARPLLQGQPELAEDLEQLREPDRAGPRPVLVMAADESELLNDLAARVRAAARAGSPGQVAVIAERTALLERLGTLLADLQVPHAIVQQHGLRVLDASVKLLTLGRAKGLDFPTVFLVALADAHDAHTPTPALRRKLYVGCTRSSERLQVLTIYEQHPPILEALPPSTYSVEGSRAAAFVGTRGTRLPD